LLRKMGKAMTKVRKLKCGYNTYLAVHIDDDHGMRSDQGFMLRTKNHLNLDDEDEPEKAIAAYLKNLGSDKR